MYWNLHWDKSGCVYDSVFVSFWNVASNAYVVFRCGSHISTLFFVKCLAFPLSRFGVDYDFFSWCNQWYFIEVMVDEQIFLR